VLTLSPSRYRAEPQHQAKIFFSYRFTKQSMSRRRNVNTKSALTVLRRPFLHRGI
jgi:hypothetical protein